MLREDNSPLLNRTGVPFDIEVLITMDAPNCYTESLWVFGFFNGMPTNEATPLWEDY